MIDRLYEFYAAKNTTWAPGTTELVCTWDQRLSPRRPVAKAKRLNMRVLPLRRTPWLGGAETTTHAHHAACVFAFGHVLFRSNVFVLRHIPEPLSCFLLSLGLGARHVQRRVTDAHSVHLYSPRGGGGGVQMLGLDDRS